MYPCDTYTLRFNKNIYLAELLLELTKYEKKKDGYKPDFENDEHYNYLENLILLLFKYVFNLSKENDIDYKDYYHNDYYCTSSSENLSEILINSSENDGEVSNIFPHKEMNAQKKTHIRINENRVDKDKFRNVIMEEWDNMEVNYKVVDPNVDNSFNTASSINSSLTSNSMSNLKLNSTSIAGSHNKVDENHHRNGHMKNVNENREAHKKQNLEEPFHENNNNHVYENFFNFDLKCNKNTQTLKEKKKVEKQILNIYYKSFLSTIIDMLLNNSSVEISDIILFFIFDNVGNIDHISSFFSKGYYTFELINTYIQQYKYSNDKTVLNKVTYKHTHADNSTLFEKCSKKNCVKSLCTIGQGNEENTQNEEENFEKIQNRKEFFPHKEAQNNSVGSTFLHEQMLQQKSEEYHVVNTDAEKLGNNITTNNTSWKHEGESISIYIDEILQKKKKNANTTPVAGNEHWDISKLKNVHIKDDTLIVENFYFKLNKSSVLLNKFISVLNIHLEKQKHFKFCTDIFFIKNLRLSFLEASKPWIFYWCIHSIYILYNDIEIEQKLGKTTFTYIKNCVFLYLNKIKNEDGAFGGGLNQYTHIATTYATVCVFIYLHDEENNFLSFLDKKKLHSYILKLKCKDGSFRLHKNGEIDMRGTYCAISICSMCHILTNQVKKNVEKYILSCQNYEGGFTSEKFQESHGGYTYCALATLCILGKIKKVNINNLMQWLLNKQGNLEGAFMGRTNKLVDACYSFWIGSIFFLINEIYILKEFLQQSKIEDKNKHVLGSDKIENNTGYHNPNDLNNSEKWNVKKSECKVKNVHHFIDLMDKHETCNIHNKNAYTKNHDNIYYSDANESLLHSSEHKMTLKSDNFNYNNQSITTQTHTEQIKFENYKHKHIEKKVMFNMNYLKLYLLVCSQGNKGGMKDKPMEKVDYYHTCYALSGLSLIQNYMSSHVPDADEISMQDNMNQLNKIHILYNVTLSKVYKCYTYFSPDFPLNKNKVNYRVGKGAYLYLKRLFC
ncbi:farnesyltransferase beta subunit [Plasmodium gonderi]|uniref:Protein farnesyltransferase subunit beta n=1 Tax=Plasmodium gonderi TaxID=77519 RepID=A0A1Y1JIN3_PLAGO|nr:farnesyltransferase beta subunit [Plasmodium gonderi]GAW81235.1 farnesyltransferase beta subunit [Plasmodium gonderi]